MNIRRAAAPTRRSFATLIVAAGIVLLLALGASLAAGIAPWRIARPSSSTPPASDRSSALATPLGSTPPSFAAVGEPYHWTLIGSSLDLDGISSAIRRADGS